jgi:hypothetical protein
MMGQGVICQAIGCGRRKLIRSLSGAVLAATINASASPAQSIAAASDAGEIEMAFLSDKDTRPPPEATLPQEPSQEPAQDKPGFNSDTNYNTAFDGKWTFTSAGCPVSGTARVTIKGGKIIARNGGGFVTPDGALHSFGAGNGRSMTAVGQLSGKTGSGTYNSSDGCVGRWIGIKQ